MGGRRDNYGGDVFWGCEHAGCCRIGEGVCVLGGVLVVVECIR